VGAYAPTCFKVASPVVPRKGEVDLRGVLRGGTGGGGERGNEDGGVAAVDEAVCVQGRHAAGDGSARGGPHRGVLPLHRVRWEAVRLPRRRRVQPAAEPGVRSRVARVQVGPHHLNLQRRGDAVGLRRVLLKG
jgi:hypothetical protein